MNWLTRIKNKTNKTGELEHDVEAFFSQFNSSYIYSHSLNVANEAAKLAKSFNYPAKEAAIAGYLHEVSAIIPNEHILDAALDMGIEVLAEEREFPASIRQKLSASIANKVFGITNKQIIHAIECHTTLKKDSSGLDLILFVADKIKWDQAGNPPYIAAIRNELYRSLEHAAFCYITYLWERRNRYNVLHPWLIDAYYDLKRKLERIPY